MVQQSLACLRPLPSMDLLDVLGLSRPVADCAVCLEIYLDDLQAGSLSELEALLLRCMQLLQPYIEGYIWQHEPFRLHSSLHRQPPWAGKNKGARHASQQQQQQQLKRHQVEQQPTCLWSMVRYEDNVDDEWFVVWLLLQLTQQLPGLSARCWDDDGDFLLIEAAYSLPRWLKPETATNRVWLRQGQLHIIPPPSAAAPSLPHSPSVTQALDILRSGAVQTRRKKVEACVLARVEGYPALATQQLQRTTMWLPRRLGCLLQADPQLVSGAVAAFMTRQRDEVQAASRLQLLPPRDMTTALVCLNRCMYAQLMQADFAPPKSYPAPPGGTWLGGDNARQHKAASMGLKLTIGMELMAYRLGLQQHNTTAGAAAATEQSLPDTAAATDGATGSPAGLSSQQEVSEQQQQQQQQAVASLSSNPAWHAYQGVLQRSGYFDGELEGSARYRQLLAAAQAAFISSDAFAQSSAALAAPKQHLLQLLQRADASIAKHAADAGAGCDGGGHAADSAGHSQQQQQQQTLSPLAAVLDIDCSSSTVVEEDGDEWMDSEVQQVQQRLEQEEQLAAAHGAGRQHKGQQGPAAAAAAGGAEGGAVVDADELLSGFRGFVQHMAGVEGAEVPAAAAAAAAAAGSSSGPVLHGSNGDSNHPVARKQQNGPDQVGHKQRGASRGAAADAAGLDFDPDVFLSELMGVLGAASGLNQQQQPQQQQQQQQEDEQQQSAAAESLLQQVHTLQQRLEQQLSAMPQSARSDGAVFGDDSDDYGSSGSSSSEEGSSFYGSDSDEPADEPEGTGVMSAALRVQEAAQEPELLHVPPPASNRRSRSPQGDPDHQHRQQGQHPQQQQQQQQGQQQWQRHDAWEVMTATDSDDDADDEDDALSMGGSSSDGSSSDASGSKGDGPVATHSQGAARTAAAAAAGFYDSYSAAMEAELSATTMAQTFEKVSITSPADDGSATAAGNHAGGAAAGAAAAAGDAGLSPLDVDMNLIRSLVASYTAQGGLPGPASNLAGLLGLQLPTEVEVTQEQQQQQGSREHQKAA